MTSSAKIAILDLVLGIIVPNEWHHDYVSNDRGGAPFKELCNHHGVLLLQDLHQESEVV